MKKITLKIFVALTVLMLLWACGNSPKNPVAEASLPPIYPDYAGVSVPVGIAPLNFEVTGADRVDVTVTGEDGGQLHVNGRLADFPVDKWRKLLEANKGKSLTVTVNARSDGKWHAYKDFKINVSPYELDAWGLTYRRIAPGYEKWGRMGLYQRQLSDFTESPILENSSFENGCLNCHSSWRTNPDRFVFHIRGTHGATLVQTEKGREWLNTKTDQTLGTCVYPYWHPSGRFVAFSTNTTRQVFHAINSERIEVFDYESDLQIYDVETHELLLSPLVKTPDWMESYPVFSPDGKTIFFCTSRQYDNIKENYKNIKYNICSISFDAESGQFGDHVDTLFNAVRLGKSAVHPRPSYDGRYLMFTICDYGCFPIWHNESEQWLMDLATGESRPIDEANSPKADSYHNWSLDSHWFVFTSRRENGLFSLLYLASVDDEGHVSKPFLLPQKDPRRYYSNLMFSYNTPDFSIHKVNLNRRASSREILSDERVKLTVKPGWDTASKDD